MPPVTDTAAAASATAVTNKMMRSLLIETPTPIATESLNTIRLSRFALINVSGVKIISQGSSAKINGQSVPQMFPASHLAIKSTFSRSADEIITIIAPDKAVEKPTPMRMRLTGCRPFWSEWI